MVIQSSFNGHSVVKLAKYYRMTGQKTEDGSIFLRTSVFGLRKNKVLFLSVHRQVVENILEVK
jgi:hypothetical protein